VILESLAPEGFENPAESLFDLAREMDGTASSVPKPDLTPPGPNGLTNSMVATTCIHILSETVAHLPFQILQRKNDHRIHRPEHRIRRLLNGKPNPEMDAMTFRETLSGHVLGWGVGYAEIEFSNAGDPLHLWPIPPWRCRPERIDGELRYLIHTKAGLKSLAPSQIFQVLWWSPNGYRPYSPVRLAAKDLRLSEKLETFALKYFDEGYHVSGFVTSPKSLKTEAIRKLRFQLEDMHKGLDRSHRVGILDEGMDWKSARLPLEEAQLLDSRIFSWQQVAALYRISADRVNILAKASYASLDATEVRFVKDAVVPLCRRWEGPVDDRLLDRWGNSGEELYSRINIDAVLRGDPKVAAEVLAIDRQWGALTADEWRAAKERNPLGGAAGEATLWPLNYAPAGENFPPESVRPPSGAQQAGAALRVALAQAVGRVLGRESKARGPAEWYSNRATSIFLLSQFRDAYAIVAEVTGKPLGALASAAVEDWRSLRLDGVEDLDTDTFLDRQVSILKQLLE